MTVRLGLGVTGTLDVATITPLVQAEFVGLDVGEPVAIDLTPLFPTRVTLDSEGLPAGLVDSGGQIGGAPSSSGPVSFSVIASDPSGSRVEFVVSTVINSNLPAVAPEDWTLTDAAQGSRLNLNVLAVSENASYGEISVDGGPWTATPAELGSRVVIVGSDGLHSVALRWIASINGIDYPGPEDTKSATASTAVGVPVITAGQFTIRENPDASRRQQVQHTATIPDGYTLAWAFISYEGEPLPGTSTTDIRTIGLSPLWHTSSGATPAGATRYHWAQVREGGPWVYLGAVIMSSAPSVSAVAAQVSGVTIALSWTEAANGYAVTAREYRHTPALTGVPSAWATLGTSPRSVTPITAPVAGDTVEVRAINAIGTGAASAATLVAGPTGSFTGETLIFGAPA